MKNGEKRGRIRRRHNKNKNNNNNNNNKLFKKAANAKLFTL